MNKKAHSPSNKVPQDVGFLESGQEILLYSSTLLRNSDKSGKEIGFLLFVRKMRKEVVNKISSQFGVKLTHSRAQISKDGVCENIMDMPQVQSVRKNRRYFIEGINGQPLVFLNIEHSYYKALKLVDSKTMLIIAILAIIPIS